MNKLREKEKAESGKKRTLLVARSISRVVTGTILTRKQVASQLPLLIMLTIMSMIYIGNIYSIERQVRKINRVNGENKELYFKQIVLKSKLTELFSRQSEVAKKLIKTGVAESVVPPQKIYSTN